MLDIVHKVIKNTCVTLAGNLIFKLISLIFVIYLAKYLKVEDFGEYNFVLTYVAIFGTFTDLGVGDISVREMSRDRESLPKIFGNIYLIKLLLTLFTILLLIIVTSATEYSKDITTYIFTASILLLFQSYSDTYRLLFQTYLKMEFEIVSKLIAKLISVLLVFYIIFVHGTLFQIILTLLISELVRALLSYGFSRRLVRPKFDIDLSLWVHLFKESFPVALSSIFLIMYHRIDILMLSFIGSSEGSLAVGLYSAAYKLSETFGTISYAFITSLFPVMSNSFNTSNRVLIQSYEMGYKLIMLLILPLTVGTMLISDKIILIIYEPSYMGSITALQILVWASFLGSLNSLMTMLLISIDKQRVNTFNMCICVLANVLMNYLLIPQYSYNGASIATVTSELIFFVLTSFCVYKYLKIFSIYKVIIKSLVCCLIMAVPVYYFNSYTNISVFLIIILAIIVYVISLFGLKIFSQREIMGFKNLFKI